MGEKVFEGKSEEEALLKASAELGMNISEMKYEVIYTETGLFGLFGRSVKIAVQVPDEASPEPTAAPVFESEEEDEEVAPAAPAQGGQKKGPEAVEALKGLLERMDIVANVSMTEDDEAVRLNIESEDSQTLVGRNGETLAALQFLLNKMVNRFPEGRKLVILDAQGFRNRREDELRRLAVRLADRAVATRRAVRLSPMSAQDRRIVHLTLKERPGVTTRSEGEGNARYLMIIPDGVTEGPVEARAPRVGKVRQGRRPRHMDRR